MTNSDYSKLADDAQLIQSILIEDTPFVAGKQDGKWYLLLGKYRLTEDLPTIVDVVEASKDTSWNRLIDICQIVAMATFQQQQEKAMAELKEKVPQTNLNAKDKERLRRYMERANDKKN